MGVCGRVWVCVRVLVCVGVGGSALASVDMLSHVLFVLLCLLVYSLTFSNFFIFLDVVLNTTSF